MRMSSNRRNGDIAKALKSFTDEAGITKEEAIRDVTLPTVLVATSRKNFTVDSLMFRLLSFCSI